MKMRISIASFLSVVLLLNVGCASHDLAYEKSRLRNPNHSTIATTASQQNQNDANLPAIAEAPQRAGSDVSWGGSLSSRY